MPSDWEKIDQFVRDYEDGVWELAGGFAGEKTREVSPEQAEREKRLAESSVRYFSPLLAVWEKAKPIGFAYSGMEVRMCPCQGTGTLKPFVLFGSTPSFHYDEIWASRPQLYSFREARGPVLGPGIIFRDGPDYRLSLRIVVLGPMPRPDRRFGVFTGRHIGGRVWTDLKEIPEVKIN